jgi:hypothetical protein
MQLHLKKLLIVQIFVLLFTITYSQTWTKLSGPSGGSITTMGYDATLANTYSLVNNFIFVSTNDGTSWTQIATPNNMYVDDFLLDGSNIVALMNTSFVQVSEDGGVTWTEKSHDGQFAHRKIRKLPQAGMFLVYGELGVKVSIDGGAIWKKILTAPGGDNIMDVRITPNGDIFLADYTLGIMKFPFPASPGDLANWNESGWVTVFPKETSNIDTDLRIGILASKVFINYRSDADGKTLFKSSGDQGASWQPLPLTGYTGNTYVLTPVWSASPLGKLYMFDNNFVGGRKAWEYSDGAPTPWVQKGWPTSTVAEQDVKSLVWKNNIIAFAGAVSDGVFKTNNTTVSWAHSSFGLNFGSGHNVAVLNSGRIVYLQGTKPKGFYYSTNGGALWEFQPFPYQIDKLLELPDNTLMINAEGYIHHSNDGGVIWTSHTAVQYEFRDLVIVAANDIYGFARDGSIKNTIDKGANWTTINTTGLPVNRQMLRATRDNDGFFYVFLQNIDEGKTQYWKLDATVDPWVATELSLPLDPMAADFPGGFFVLNNKLHVSSSANLVSADKGVTWKNLGISGHMIPVEQGVGGVVVSSDGNISVTQDDGVTFKNIQLPDKKALIREISIDPNGDFIAAASNSPALKFTDDLVLAPEDLAPYIDFNWQPVSGGPFGGDVNDIKKNSTGQLFAQSGLSLFRYNSSASRWDALPVNSVGAFMIDNTDKIYATYFYGGLYRSTDNGDSFTKTQAQVSVIRSIIKAANGDIIIGTNDGLMKSTDDGDSFTQVYSGRFTALVISGNGTLLAGEPFSTNIIRSTDNGASWSPSTSGIDFSTGVSFVSANKADGNNMVVVTSNNIYKSSNDGVTWTSIKSNMVGSFNSFPDANFFLSPTNEYVLASNVIYFSTNQGGTWTTRSLNHGIHTMVWSGTDIYTGGYSGVSKSTDNAITFTAFNKGITALAYKTLELYKEKLVTLTTKPYVSSDFGTTWTEISIPFGQTVSGFVKPADGSLIAYGQGIYKSLDALTWTTLTNQGNYYHISTANGTDFYAYAYDNTINSYRILFSTNLIDWTPVAAAGLPATLNVVAMANDASGKIYLVDYASSVYQIAFGTVTKISFEGIPTTVTYHNGKILAHVGVGGSSRIHETTDGVSWFSKVTPDGAKLIITALNYFFIPAGGGILWVSRDLGITWQNVGDSDLVLNSFGGVVLNEFNGNAYGIVNYKAVQKSSSIVVPDDKTAPAQASFFPVAGATNVKIDSTLSITFNEATFPVATKKLKVFLKNDPNPFAELDATAGVRDGRTFTFTLATPLTYLSEYYIVIDNGAFKDLFNNLYTGIVSDQTWKFTTMETPDATSPVITYAPTNANFDKGSASKKFIVTVTDNKAVAAGTVKIKYRKITSPAAHIAEVLTPGTGANEFMLDLSGTVYDDIGLELFFTAEDQAGNLATSSTFYSYVSQTATNPPLSGLAWGGTLESYRVISMPYNLDDSKISTVLNELGEPNENVWRMFTYNNGASPQWIEYPGFTNFERGKGYWINIKEQREVKIEGASSPPNNQQNFFSMTLQPGWNQVGNPYPIAISWEETRTGNDQVGFSTFKKYANGTYQTVDQVSPFEGGFVYSHEAASTTIKIRFPGFTSGGRTKEVFDSEISSTQWLLPIILTQQNLESSISGIGMHPDAKDGLDRLDDLNPPRFLRAFELTFKKTNNIKEEISLDIVPTKDQYKWTFDVNTDLTGMAMLSWDNKTLGDNNKELYLFDIALQHAINMREYSSYSFDPKKSKSFRIYFGENVRNQIKPDFIFLGDAHPNPASGKAIFPFTLPGENSTYQVTIQVLDMNSRIIATVMNSDLPSGFHQKEWTTTANDTPPGMYVYRLLVNNSEGQQVYNKKIVFRY